MQMKVFSLLAGILIQEGRAACPDGKSIIEVTCHEDLTIQLAIDQDCLTEKFPDVKVTELIISKTGAPECKSCIAADPQTTDSTASDYCNPKESFFAYDYLDTSQDNVPVTTGSTDIWFKAGECGSSMDATGSMAEFQTKIFKPMTVDQATQIVSQKTILPTDIICEYPKEIVGIRLDSDANIQADGSTDEEKVDGNVQVDPIGKDKFSLTVKNVETDTKVEPVTQVSVGTPMSITVFADLSITEYFLSDCTATNRKVSPDKSLDLINDGCMVDLGDVSAIDAKSPNPGNIILFNQFGFADQSSGQLTLNFVLTCTIKLGTAPTDAECQARYDDDNSSGLQNPGRAGRRRRETETTEFTQTTEYTITLSENMLLDTHGDIVVLHSGPAIDAGDILDDETDPGGKSDAVINVFALAVSSVIMLL